ncbi:MAG: glycosyltransferase family 4 protein [Candidatus Buchananbacteria bacterium]
MRILILSDGFPPDNAGGAERIASNMYQGLRNRGHEVFVLTTTPKKSQENLGAEGIYRLYIKSYPQIWRAYLGLYNPFVVRRATKIIKTLKPEVVHAHNVHYLLSYQLLKVAKKSGAKVFLTAHDVALFHYGKLVEFLSSESIKDAGAVKGDIKFNYQVTGWQQLKRFKKRYNPLRNILIRRYLKYVDKIFAVSQALKQALEQNGLKNIEVIYNGIETDNWQILKPAVESFKIKYNLKEKRIIFFGGRLSTLKGGKNMIEVIEQVRLQVPQAVLLIVGQKDDQAKILMQQVKTQNLPVFFTGWLVGQDLLSAYWSSEVVVVPSLYLDPFPTINLEAMACHRPIVGTCFGGTPEIVLDNQTGFIVNPFNTKLLAEKIIYFLDNIEVAKKIGESGYQRVNKFFSLDKQINETLIWYQKQY